MPVLQAADLVANVCAENSVGRLIQQTLHPNDFSVQIDLADTATFASMVVMCEPTGELKVISFQRLQKPVSHASQG
jgi:hypothetical protein